MRFIHLLCCWKSNIWSKQKIWELFALVHRIDQSALKTNRSNNSGWHKSYVTLDMLKSSWFIFSYASSKHQVPRHQLCLRHPELVCMRKSHKSIPRDISNDIRHCVRHFNNNKSTWIWKGLNISYTRLEWDISYSRYCGSVDFCWNSNSTSGSIWIIQTAHLRRKKLLAIAIK